MLVAASTYPPSVCEYFLGVFFWINSLEPWRLLLSSGESEKGGRRKQGMKGMKEGKEEGKEEGRKGGGRSRTTCGKSM